MEKKDVRVTLLMSPADIAALDAWRAEHHIWSRSEAIRSLVFLGIAASQENAGASDKASPRKRR